MLIKYTVENFLSFRDRITFSMLPGKGSLKPNHKSSRVKGVSALKAGVIFGANASGKSNLIKAIGFGKELVLRGAKSDLLSDFQLFRLDSFSRESNTRMEYEIQHRGKNYAYGFVFNSQEIVEEWLYEFTNRSEKKIFDRNNKGFDLEPICKKNPNILEQQFLEFTAKGTPSNQLFLTEVRTRKVKENVKDISDLLNVFDWFFNALKVVFPDMKYNDGIKYELKKDNQIQLVFEELLKYFGTGVDGICLKELDFNTIGIPQKIKDSIVEEFKEGHDNETTIITLVSPNNETYFFSNNMSKIIAEKFMTKHIVRGAEYQEYFDTCDESDGTNRIIDFIPLILDLLSGDNVFIIDEMERSLHPNLIFDIFDLYLENSHGVNSQLITASHESSLLTQTLFRKDEIWFVVKDGDGASKLHSLEEYNVRFDKEIRKDYLIGRYKGIPRLGNRKKLTVLPLLNGK